MKRIILLSLFSLLTSCATTSATTTTNVPIKNNTQVAEQVPAVRWGQTVVIVGNKMQGNFYGGSLGKMMDAVDNMRMNELLQKGYVNQTSQWKNNMTHKQFIVTVRKPYQGNNGQTCRDYSANVKSNGHLQHFTGSACLAGDGNYQFTS